MGWVILPSGPHHGALTLADLCAKGFYLCVAVVVMVMRRR